MFKSISTALSDKTYLHHWLLASLSVQLQLQLPHSVLSFPQLLSSPPLALFALSLQVWQLLSTLLQGHLQLLHSAAEVFILLAEHIKQSQLQVFVFEVTNSCLGSAPVSSWRCWCVSPWWAWCWTGRGWLTAAAGGLGSRSGSVSDSRSLLTDTAPASLSLWPPEETKHEVQHNNEMHQNQNSVPCDFLTYISL